MKQRDNERFASDIKTLNIVEKHLTAEQFRQPELFMKTRNFKLLLYIYWLEFLFDQPHQFDSMICISFACLVVLFQSG